MVFSLPLTAFASDYDFPEDRIFYMSCVEPPTNANQGYINLLYRNDSDSSDYKVFSYFWTCMSVGGDSDYAFSDDCSVAIDISKANNTVKLSCYTSLYDYTKMSVGYGRIQNGTGSAYYSAKILSDSLDTIVTFSPSGWSLIGYQVYGNGIVTSSDFPSSGVNASKSFIVNWGTEALSYSQITEIIAELYVLAGNDETIIGQLNELLAHAQTAEDLLIDIKYWVNSCNDKLQVGNNTLKRIEDLLKQIVKAKGESTFEEPSTESISDYNKAEDELVSGADDTSDIEQQIEDFEIDANASGKIWDIITQFFNSHPKIMGLVIGILCLGIIALILNR